MAVFLLSEIDALQVAALEVECSRSPWGLDQILIEIKKDESWFAGIKDSQMSSLIGYYFSRCLFDDAHLLSVGVRYDLRRQGLGTHLVEHFVETSRARHMLKASLEVRPSNRNARSVYSKIGFKEVGLRKCFYSDNGEDAIIMSADL